MHGFLPLYFLLPVAARFHSFLLPDVWCFSMRKKHRTIVAKLVLHIEVLVCIIYLKAIDAGRILFANPNSVSYTPGKPTSTDTRRSTIKAIIMDQSNCHVLCSHHHVQRSLNNPSNCHSQMKASSALAKVYWLVLHLRKGFACPFRVCDRV